MNAKIPFVFAVLALALLAAGCVDLGGGGGGNEQGAGAPPAGAAGAGPQGANGFGRGFNMTPEQAQAIGQARLQAQESACAGKAEGESCTMNFSGASGFRPAGAFGGNFTPRNRTGTSPSEIPRTPRNAVGTCQTQDGKLLCVTAQPSGQPG